jgi:hypothetical protein
MLSFTDSQMIRDATCACVAEQSPCETPSAEKAPNKATARVRVAVFDDYDRIISLQIRNGLSGRAKSDWLTLWKGNPIYEELQHRFPIGWVLETPEGEIVGSIGNIPLACHFRGRKLLTAAACDWVVDPCYRSSSMHLLDHFMNQNETDLFVTTTASANSEPALKMFEWSRVPVKGFDKSAFWITNYRGFAKSLLTLKSVPMPAVLNYPVAAALFCRDTFRNGVGRNESNSSFALELCSEFDSRFDDFWSELKQQNDNILLPYRTRKTLEWHFRSPLMRQELMILAKSEGSRLVAYAIFDRQDRPASGLKRLRLVDFQALTNWEDVLARALCWMLKECRECGLDLLENVGGWLDLSRLPTLRKPYYRSLRSALYYYHAPDTHLSEALNNPAVWSPTTYDGDASL